MAKKRTVTASADDLPGVIEPAVRTPLPKPKPEPKGVPLKVTAKTLRCSVPFIDGVQGYCRRRVDVTLTGSQAERLKGILQGLETQNAKLENGRYVTTPMHAIQWVLENAG